MDRIYSLVQNYYYIIVILQAICVIHCYKKGNQNQWIWLIIFLPFIGCLIYIFTEIFTRNDMEQVQSNMGAVFNPSGKIKKLQDRLRFADTFNNRIELADAYLEVGQTDKAIELYEGSLTGNFKDNEQGNMQLIKGYFAKRRFEDVVRIGRQIKHLPQFARSKAHMLYAIALGNTNHITEAEKEYGTMKGRFDNYECRYNYALFLKQQNRDEESINLLKEIANEETHLSGNEKRMNRQWFAAAKQLLKQDKV